MTTSGSYIFLFLATVIFSSTSQPVFTNPHGTLSEPGDTSTNKFTEAEDTNSPAESYKMGELVVQGTLFEEKLARAPGSISVLQQEELQTGDRMSLTEYLDKAPGVFVQQGAYNTSRVIIRGVGSRTPYTSNKIRAYLDEIPLTSGDGVSSLEDIDLSYIGKVEVIRGPTGALYGSGMGGTIRLFTEYPDKGNRELKARAETASWGTERATVRGFLRTGNILIAAGANYSHSDGYRQNSIYNRASALLNLHHYSENSAFQLLMLFIHLDAQIPSSIDSLTFETNPRAAAKNWLNVKGYESYDKLLSGISYKKRLNDRWENTASLFSTVMNKYEFRPFNILDDGSVNAGFRNRLKYTGKTTSFIFGIEGITEKYPWKTFEVDSLNQQGSLIDYFTERTSYANFSALNEWSVTPKLNISEGINCNLLTYRLKNNTNDSVGRNTYTYKPVLSPRIGINYQIIDEVTFYSSFGHGFSPPSLEETILSTGVPNENIKPESGWNLDAGMRIVTKDKRLFTDITCYKIWLRNLLVTKRESESVFYGINAGKTSLEGLEMSVKYRLLGDAYSPVNYLDLNLSGVLSGNRFTDFVDDGMDRSGKILPGIPDNQLYAGITGQFSRYYFFNVNLRHAGAQYLDDANTGKAAAWNLLNAEIAYTVFPRNAIAKLFCGVRNLLDENYAAMILVNAPSFGTAKPRYYYPGTARNFYLGISISVK